MADINHKTSCYFKIKIKTPQKVTPKVMVISAISKMLLLKEGLSRKWPKFFFA